MNSDEGVDLRRLEPTKRGAGEIVLTGGKLEGWNICLHEDNRKGGDGGSHTGAAGKRRGLRQHGGGGGVPVADSGADLEEAGGGRATREGELGGRTMGGPHCGLIQFK
jgi:hypothetical protein